MPNLTPQDIHREAQLLSPGLPGDWAELSELQQQYFINLAIHLNRVVQGEITKRLPSRKSLVAMHQRAIDELQNKPLSIGNWYSRFLEGQVNIGLQQYHRVALDYLQSGGDIANTIDALSEEELLMKMQGEGFFVCFHREDDR